MQNFRHLILCFALCTTLIFTACTNGQHQDDDLPLMGLQALQTKSTNGLSGTITVYDLNGKVYLTEDLIFTADTIYAPHLSLPKNTVYRLILVFYYDDDLPIAFLDEDITVGSEASYSFTLSKENIHFSLSEITSDSVLASLSNDVDTGILPDLDLDDDGFSNIVEYRGGSDPRDDTSIPHGPDFDSIDVEYAPDGNLVTITVELSDGNYVTSVEPSVSNYGYLQRGGIFTEDLSGDDLDKNRTYTLSFNPQYAPIGELTLNFTATNSIDLVSTDSVVLDIEDNGENVGPVIVFDSLSADDVIDGDVEVAMTAYDRDTVTSLDLTSPTSISDTASEAAYFVGTWDTGSQDDGDFTVIATSEDLLGETTTRRLAISINNGSDGSGPGLQMSIYNANHASIEIDYLNGEAVFGIAPFRVVANDASDVSYIQLTNLGDLNCTGADLSDCPLTDHSAGLDDFITSNSAYTNSFDTTAYNDGDVVEMTYLTGDSHGSTRERTFSFTIQNAPTINSVSTSQTTITDGSTVKINWGVEDRTTAVYILDAESNTIDCEEGTSTGDGDCTFTPTQSQAYTVRAAYSVENQYGDMQTFYTDQNTDTVNLDFDNDGILDESDNCYKTDNADQVDADADEHGDVCDPDIDGDGYAESGYVFATNYELYVGAEVTADNQEYATLYSVATYDGIDDCDDTNSERNPGENEKLNADADDNCDGLDNIFDFSDEDSFDFSLDGDDQNIFQILGEGSADRFGTDVKSIGDFDGDGYEDYAVSAVTAQVYGQSSSVDEYAGAIYIFLGPITNGQTILASLTTADLAIYGFVTDDGEYSYESNPSAYGDRLSTITSGDFDGDGCPELAIGAKGTSSEYDDGDHEFGEIYEGRVTVIWGCDEAGNRNTNLFPKYNASAPSHISIDEFMNDGLYEDQAVSFYSDDDYSFFGSSLDMGDLDGDGHDELIVGAPNLPNEKTQNSNTSYGPDSTYMRTSYQGSTARFYVIYGPELPVDRPSHEEFDLGSTTISGTPNMRVIRVNSTQSYDNLGSVVKYIGDLDGDGVAELAVNAPYHGASSGNTSKEGVVYLFAGTSFVKPSLNTMSTMYVRDTISATSLYYEYKISGSKTGEKLGSSTLPTSDTFTVSDTIAVADFDPTDEYKDLVIAAPAYDAAGDGVAEGRVYVFSGATIVADPDHVFVSSEANRMITGPIEGTAFGYAVEACDVTGDDITDIFASSTTYSDSQGVVWGFDGTDVGDSTTDDVFSVFYGNGPDDGTGSSSFNGSLFGNTITCLTFDNDGLINDLSIGEWTNRQAADPNAGAVYFIKSDYE